MFERGEGSVILPSQPGETATHIQMVWQQHVEAALGMMQVWAEVVAYMCSLQLHGAPVGSRGKGDNQNQTEEEEGENLNENRQS